MLLTCCPHTVLAEDLIWDCFWIRALSDEVSSLSSYWSLNLFSSTLINAHMQALVMLLRSRSGGCSLSWHGMWKNANIKPRESWVHCSSGCLSGDGSSTALCGHFEPVPSSKTKLTAWEADEQVIGHILLNSYFQDRFNLRVHININIILPAHRKELILPWGTQKKKRRLGF